MPAPNDKKLPTTSGVASTSPAGSGAPRTQSPNMATDADQSATGQAKEDASARTPAGNPGSSSLLPTLSIPTGGGAIRGIGEKLNVNAATGTASLSVPLPISPGRGGMQPAVALQYDGGSGNGPFGLGFQLSVPSITRKTEQGLPRYWDDEDTFVLSGAEDLVPVIDATGQPVATVRGAYTVYQYRPRVEGLFARIERLVDAVGGSFWQVTTRDNVTHVYGRSDAASLPAGVATPRIADPDSPRRVFSWLLEESRDDRGNVVVYEYKAEDGVGVDPLLTREASRFVGGVTRTFVATAQRYLKRVRYCNVQPDQLRPYTADDFSMEVVFDYGDHSSSGSAAAPIPTVAEDQAWPVRQDAFSSFRAGFEVRTYRLCRRVLLLHRFGAPGAPLLVKSTDFTFDPGPAFTYLTRVTQVGYLDDGTGALQRAELPSLDLDYTRPVLNDQVSVLPEASQAGLAGGVDGVRKQWLDFDSEGIPGVLIDEGSAWYYQRNLGGGVLQVPERVKSMPGSASLQGGVQQLEDLGGDGQLDLVSYAPPLVGYFAREPNGEFAPLRRFQTLPNIDFRDPNMRLIDLDGDGHADLLITEEHAFRWYPSKAKQGFSPAERVAVSTDEDWGPRVVFSDEQQRVQLADMSGDGLVDIVRIRNGEVCYWPNLGYGRFGRKIVLENSPHFAAPDAFDAKRIRFADVDGSGTSDIFYLDSHGVTLYRNQAGNRLGNAEPLRSLPPVTHTSQFSVVDLLGTGTMCLVWSSSLGGGLGATNRRVLYVDLMAGTKPHLLKSVDNNLGAKTVLSHAPSTQFYLADRASGHPWITRLSFPVHVVARVERTDAISGSRLISTYSYHHGYFDGDEREFRGFARVEQRDAEEFDGTSGSPELLQPPVLIKTWYHTGAWLSKERLEEQLQLEYTPGSPGVVLARDTVLPSGLSLQDQKEATRALKGSPLRTEIYAEDGTPLAKVPYVVTETNQQVRVLQSSRGEGKHGVFLPHARESITISTERNPLDPRVAHQFVLEVDAFGAVTADASLVYGRIAAAGGGAPTEQSTPLLTLTTSQYTHQANATGPYRIGTLIAQRTYEVTGLSTLAVPQAGQGLLDFEVLRSALAALSPAQDLAYETPGNGAVLERRLLEHHEQTFYTDDLLGEGALGAVGTRALPYQRYQLALTPGLVQLLVTDSSASTAAPLDPAILTTDGAYAQRNGSYFTQSGRVVFDATRFYQPVSAVDPFGGTSSVTWDSYGLLPLNTTDAVGNVVSVVNDYRVLAPSEVTDPNWNRVAVEFDALGMVVATAVMGKLGAGEGDTLAAPTTRLTYDVLRWQTSQRPVVVTTFARERHGSANPRFQESRTYSDGFGRVVMMKAQAEPGDAPLRDPSGVLQRNPDNSLVIGPVAERWVGSGRTIFNNKGKPVKQYEPFFSSTPEYESEADLVEWGVTPILRYDPLDRVIQTDLPDGTLTRVEFDSWEQRSFDANDTVLESDWYEQRGRPDPNGAMPTTPDGRAAWLAAQHAGTFTVTQLDVLGRAFTTKAHNRIGTGSAAIDATYETRTRLDIEGNVLAVFDARQVNRNPTSPVATLQQVYDVQGRRLRVASADAGVRLSLQDTAGKPLRTWNSRGFTGRASYDAAQRLTHSYVAKGGVETLVARVSYGEALDPAGPGTNPATPSPAQALNLRGRAHLTFDGAGLTSVASVDFKGNVLVASRRLATAYQTTPDWYAIAGNASPATLESNAPLEAESFTTQTTYDALNRVVQATAPDGSITTPSYNEANLLERLVVDVHGAGNPQVVVGNLEYNARGQRLRCEHAQSSGTPSHVIEYTYDPKTFRVSRIRTTRSSDGAMLQLLDYTYDPVGNITELREGANWDPVLSALTDSGISGSGRYEYDALYRLVSATGREHPSLQTDNTEPPLYASPHGSDLQQLRSYVEELSYDEVGNITQMRHLAGPSNSQSWSRQYRYADDNNRLLATSQPGDPSGTFSATYGYGTATPNDGGLHGSMTSMPHLAALHWDHADRLQFTSKSVGSNQHTYFTYDAAGERVRKVYEHDGIVEERIYLGGYELYRRRAGALPATVQVERQTLHVMDDTRRVALVETKTVDTLGADATPIGIARWRYQLDNHLGSSALELSETAAVISYEEYHPYGTTAFHSTSGAVSQKRYRYTGKEKDDETGLYYHGARYYAPWLGRWTAADPAGMVDGLNLYRYSRDNPIVFSDPGGTQSENEYSSGPNELILQGTYVDNGQVIARYGAFDGEFVYEEVVGDAPTPAPAPKEPAKPKPAPVKEAAPAAEGDQGSIGEQFLRGAVLGDYGGEPTAASIVGQVAVGFTPLGVAADVRDFTAALGDYRAGKEGAGLNLVLAGVGFLPFGDLAKIARKGDDLLKAGADVTKNLDKADEVVEAASRMNSSNALSGVERASDELLESVGRKRSVEIVSEGSEELRYLDAVGAEANVGGETMSHILLRPNPSKAAVLEEFLHGTQHRLGIIERKGVAGAEWHVKDFMIRHAKMLGLSQEDVSRLKTLRDMGL